MLGPSISTPEGDSNSTLAFTGASAISLVAPSLASVLVSLEVNYGTLSIPSDNSVSSSSHSVNDGQGTQLSIQGTAQAVDAALDSLDFSLPSADLDVSENFGGDYLSINATGFNAGGNALPTTTDSVILQMPDDPTVAVPASFAAASGQTLSFNGSNAIVISNQEYPSDTYWVSLTVSDGTFSFAGSTLPAGAFFQPGSNDQSLFLPGTIGELNTDLSELQYTSAAGAADSLTMQVSDESSDNASRYELLNLPINQPSTTGTGSSETLSASITTSGAMTQGSTVTATAAVTGTSSNSSLTYAWTVTAPNGTSVSVGTSATISFTASQVGNYSLLVSVSDAPNSVSTAAAAGTTITTTGPTAWIDTVDVNVGDTATATADVAGFSPTANLSYAWTVTAPDGTAVPVGNDASISFPADEPGAYSLSVIVTDANSSANVTASASVSSVVPPSNIGTVQMPTIDENSASPAGVQISSLQDLSGNTLADVNPDIGDVGIALTNVDTSNGTWQYSLGGGTSWAPVPAVSDTNALLLDPTDRIRFLPNEHFIGVLTDALDFLAWNTSVGAGGQIADTTAGPIASAVSDDGSFATLDVQPVVSITASGTQFIVSTDTAVPNDVIVEVNVTSSYSTDPNALNDGSSVYLTSNDTVSQLGLTGIVVYIPAGSSQIAVDVNAGPELTAQNVTATIGSPSTAGLGNSDFSSFAVDPDNGQASLTTAANSPPNPNDTGVGWSFGATAGVIGWMFTDASGTASPSIDATSFTVSFDGFWGNMGYVQSCTITWTMVDGTATGADYTSGSGTISYSGDSSAGATSTTVGITHHLNAGDRDFFLVFNTTYTYNLYDGGGSHQGAITGVVPIDIANPELYMYGDTTGSGQPTLNVDDPPSDPNYTTENPLVIPVTAASSGNSPDISSVSGNLIPLQIDAVGAPGDTLVLAPSSGSGAFQLYTDAAGADPIPTSFSYGNFPTTVYVGATQAGSGTVTEELLAQNRAEIGEKEVAVAGVQMDIDYMLAGSGTPVQGIKNKTQSVWIGQDNMVSLNVAGVANGSNVTGIQWSKPMGDIIQSAVQNLNVGQTVPFDATQVNFPLMSWYWVAPGTGLPESVSFDYQGHRYTLTTTFDVQAPTIAPTANSMPGNSGTISTLLPNGDFQLQSPGMDFAVTRQDQGVGRIGTIAFVQTVTTNSILLNGGAVTTTVGLDTTFPYGSYPMPGMANAVGTDDQPLYVADKKANAASISEVFSMYVMFNPDPTNLDNIYVPLWVFNWQWVVKATKPAGGVPMAVTPGTDQSTKGAVPGANAVNNFPTWTGLATAATAGS